MKNLKFIAVSVLALVGLFTISKMFISPVMAMASGDPITSLWDAVRNVQARISFINSRLNQITALRGIPGIQGPKGENGSNGDKGDNGLQGVKGDQGERGPRGEQFHLFDANGQDLGVFLNVNGSVNQYQTFIPSMGVIAFFTSKERSRIEVDGNASSNYGPIYFNSSNCTGDAFMVAQGGNLELPQTFVKITPTRYGVLTQGRSVNRIALSYYKTLQAHEGDVLQCYTYTDHGEIPETYSSYLVHEITPPYHEPIAWPLEIRSQ